MELRFDKHIYECKVTCKANGQSLIKMLNVTDIICILRNF